MRQHAGRALLALAIAAAAALTIAMPADAQSWRDRVGSYSDRDYDQDWRGDGNSGG